MYSTICAKLHKSIYTFVTQPLNHMRQNERNRHKNRPCKWAFKLHNFGRNHQPYSISVLNKIDVKERSVSAPACMKSQVI